MLRGVGLLALTIVLASTQSASADEERPAFDYVNREGCAAQPERCGATVVWGPDYAGVDNCTLDPNCLTRRIVHRGSGASDFIAVPDHPGNDTNGTDPGDATGAPATGPRCTPRPPARVAPDLAQTDLPPGRIEVNPHHRQLTGLESWLWYEGDSTATWTSPVAVGIAADCSIIPPPATQTYSADLVSVHWHIDDSRPASHTSTHPGTETDPAVRHTWRTKGTWTVTATCVWHGAWGQQTSADCATRTLDVVEVRTRLQN